MTLFINLLDVGIDDKSGVLGTAIREFDDRVYDVDPVVIVRIPGSPFAYWASQSMRDVFARLPSFENQERRVKVGMQTSDDARFVRTWWEVAPQSELHTWVPFAKGGKVSSFYSDIPLVLKFADEGREVSVFRYAHRPREGVRNRGQEFYLRRGLTWSLRARKFSPQVLPDRCVFSNRSYCVFVPAHDLAATLAVFNASVFDYLFKLALGRFGFPEFVIGVLQKLPWATPSEQAQRELSGLALRSWSLKRTLDSVNETSHAFLLPACLRERASRYMPSEYGAELSRIQAQVDAIALQVYDLGDAERAIIESWVNRAETSNATVESGEEQTSDTVDDESSDDEAEEFAADDSETLLSWAVGVCFARFDPRLAIGERAVPSEPEPFDPLPSHSPGMYSESEEAVDRPDILVDDAGHRDDLPSRALAVAERVKVDVSENLRAWLAKEFFPLHIKMYSKSRRKAPIYWQLATPSASYSVWLYIHAFSKDTLFRVQNDYVGGERGKLAHEERRLESLTSELRDGATAAQRKVLAAQEALVEELRAFLDEVKRVAPLWKPNLDDGVIINFAPLWRLVPQNKSWQKELKSTWSVLCDGKYDWAHLAMHLWPERVVPKCARDRSLAIAHGLEDVFWVEGNDGKWIARTTPTRGVDELVKERSSPAVKSALKSLLEAPAASGKSFGRKGGGRRKAAATAEGGDV